MSDLIRRQDAIDAVFELSDKLANEMLFIDAIVDEIENLPSIEPEQEEFEWCHDCKEYDQEKHCCHRWTKVIRQTVEEMKRQYTLEYPEIVHQWFGGDFYS